MVTQLHGDPEAWADYTKQWDTQRSTPVSELEVLNPKEKKSAKGAKEDAKKGEWVGGVNTAVVSDVFGVGARVVVNPTLASAAGLMRVYQCAGVGKCSC